MRRKFISMICALSMIFSVVGSLTAITASAADAAVIGTATYDKETKKAAITVSYTGFNKLKAFQVFVPVDTTIFNAPSVNEDNEVVDLTSTEKFASVAATSYDKGYVKYVFVPMKASQYVTDASSDVFTLELTVADESKLPATIELTGIAIMDNDGTTDVSYGTSDQNPDVVVNVINPTVEIVTPTDEPTATPTATPTVAPATVTKAVKEIVGSDNASAIESEYASKPDDEIALIITFKNASGTAITPTYGTDFVVVDGAGNALSEAEYSNMVNGWDTEKLVDLLKNGGSFYIYNDKIETITADVYDYTDGEYIGDTTDTTLPTATVAPTATTSTATDAPTPTATTSSRRNNGSTSSDSGKGGSIYTGTGTTGTTSSTGTTSTVDFTDLYNVESWAGDAIRGLAAKGVVNGRTSTLFDPEANVTRAEFTKMLVGALGVSTSGAPDPGFADVASTDWSYGYIAAAKYLGLVTGRTDTIFDPNAQISRQEAAAMIYRASTTTNKTLTAVNAAVNFIDQADISEYAVTSVTTLQQAGIINGFEDSSFRPNDNATRAQAAVMLWKYMNL